MSSTPGTLYVLAFLGFLGTFVGCSPEVKLLHVVFRHGDKVPHAEYQNYPKDPYGNHSYFPIASGGLTNEGKLREYEIGRMLRRQYDQFFGTQYWPDAIYAQSTEVIRAQMSLQLVLAGLFPPVGEQKWHTDLSWQPVTTFFQTFGNDPLLFPQYCPLYKKEYKKFLQQDDVRRIVNKWNSTMAYLTKHTGKTVETTKAVYYLYNLLKEQEKQGLTLPDWTKAVYPSPMNNITILDFQLGSFTTNLKRLGGGTLLRKITDDMKSFTAGRLMPPERKAFFFSGHEQNIARVSFTLGMNYPEIQLPPYGSTIIIETIEDLETEAKYFVRVLLWTGVTEKLIIRNIPGCTEMCPLEKFLTLYKDVIANDAEYHCSVDDNDGEDMSSGSNSFCINIWLLSVVWLLLLSIASYSY